MRKIINRFKSPAEFGFILVVFFIALYFFIDSFHFTGMPRVFPRFTSLSTMIFAGAYALKRIRSKSEEPEEKEKSAAGYNTKNVILTVGFFGGYLIVVWLFGFLVAAILMVVLYPLIMGYRKPVAMLVCLLINAGVVIGFQKLLGFSLTRGRFLDLTRFFF